MHRPPQAGFGSSRPLFRAFLTLVCLSPLVIAEDLEQEQREALEIYTSDIQPILEARCVPCHGGEKTKGDVDFARFTGGVNPLSDRGLWTKALKEIDHQEMPPKDAPQLSETERYRLRAWLHGMKRSERPNPGTTVIRRLSKLEYANTIRDLFGVDLKVGENFPDDQAGEGFDNAVSPLLMEKYLIAADQILDELISSDQVELTLLAGGMNALIGGVPHEGKSDGKERTFLGPGEIFTLLDLPEEGVYTIEITASAEQAGPEAIRLGVRGDGETIKELRLTGGGGRARAYTVREKFYPGPVRLALTWLNAAVNEVPPVAPKRTDQKGAEPAVRSLTIEKITLTGPRAKPPTAFQRQHFIAAPGQGLSPREAARKILEPFVFRAYRRPTRPEEIAVLLKVFDLAESRGLGFSDGVRLMFKAVLLSPQFIFRTPDAPDKVANGVAVVGDFELASRLSYFLWSTMPDAELFELARRGTLHDPQVLEAQARRMIKDPRSQAMVDTFAGQWLHLNELDELIIDEQKFPMMTKAMRQSMRAEATTFIGVLLHEGGSILDMLDCDYTYMDSLTAPLYGVDSVKASKMERVRLSDRNRGGLMTMPGILAVTSIIDRTSPVRRGKWILENLFDASPPPPPPDVAPLDQQDTQANAKLTLRQKTELHRTDPACSSCHTVMDPLGFGFENFDAIGRWRTLDDSKAPIDARGELPGKVTFATPVELKQILMKRQDDFTRVFIAKLMAFALSRTLTDYDGIVVDDLADLATKDGHRLDDLVVRLVTSYSFVHRQPLN